MNHHQNYILPKTLNEYEIYKLKKTIKKIAMKHNKYLGNTKENTFIFCTRKSK